MKAQGHSLLKGMRGRLQHIVARQVGDTTVISVRPDMSSRKLSAKQKVANERMREAVFLATQTIGNRRSKLRAAELLKVPVNKVYHAVIKEYLLKERESPVFQHSDQEKKDQKTLATIRTTILSEIPDATIYLFGDRAKGTRTRQSDWDLLIISNNEYPNQFKWDLQEKLFDITKHEGSRVALMLFQNDKWLYEPEMEPLRTRLRKEMVDTRFL